MSFLFRVLHLSLCLISYIHLRLIFPQTTDSPPIVVIFMLSFQEYKSYSYQGNAVSLWLINAYYYYYNDHYFLFGRSAHHVGS